MAISADLRRPFTSAQAAAEGITHSGLKWRVKTGKFQRVEQGVYIAGGAPPTDVERSLALVVATDGAAGGTLAGILHDLDIWKLRQPSVLVRTDCRRREVRQRVIEPIFVEGFACSDGLQTIRDLAVDLGDLEWEQALESALYRKLLTIEELVDSLAERRIGNDRIRRVLALRPPGAPPTESMLETLALQLIRRHPRLPTPSRQVVVHNRHDEFVARVDLAWPEFGIFLELDGEHHDKQPVYDANRQTRVVAATGWLPGRFSWTEITKLPTTTGRRLAELFELPRIRAA